MFNKAGIVLKKAESIYAPGEKNDIFCNISTNFIQQNFKFHGGKIEESADFVIFDKKRDFGKIITKLKLVRNSKLVDFHWILK